MEKISLADTVKSRGLKYYINTYGCQMNAHDSEKLAGILGELGFAEGSSSEESDFVIFNTCCVRENAELKIFGNVGALRQKKKKNRNMIVAVCGCMMQQQPVAEKLFSMFPFVDIVFGTNNMYKLPEMVYRKVMQGERTLLVEEENGDIVEDIPMHRNVRPLASVSIMRGCDNFCSYCIVPYVRGREKSREPERILEEIRALSADGYREVLLLGQNVNSYGKGTDVTFPKLLERIVKETAIDRIRFMTPHPKDVSDDLIRVVAENERVCSHIHLPLQSGSNKVLELMNRHYTREDYLALVKKIRREIPDAALSTDIIVGFPQETEEDFQDTLELVQQVGFDSAYTFVYSVRAGTKAEKLPGHLSDEVKKDRIMRLVALQNEITYAGNKRDVGKVERVLIESVSKRDAGCVCGRTDGGKMVNMKGGEELIGTFADVEITEGKKTTVFGRIVNGNQTA